MLLKVAAPGRSSALSAALLFCQRGDPLDPLDYRKLSILSKVYRLHMSIRLKDLAPWVSTWTLPELFAGTCAPNGAEDAWFETALIMELAKLQDNPLTGWGPTYTNASTRSPLRCYWICYGPVVAPPQVVRAYQSFHTAIVYHNSVAGSLGKPHRHFCGIPQSCPLSMTWTAFMLVP